jgi:hypothetical protein
MMSLSKVIKHENGIDLCSLAPDAIQHHWKIDWGAIMAAQVGGIYMRPIMTLTPNVDPHWVCIFVLRGRLLLLDTWDDPNISWHTRVSMAMHTVPDGHKQVLECDRIQLPSQRKTRQCWSRLFVHMARLASKVTHQTDFDEVLDIIGETTVIKNSEFDSIRLLCDVLSGESGRSTKLARGSGRE